MRCSIALDNMNKTILLIDKDQKVSLLHTPFKGTTFFRGEMAKIQKANTDGAGALAVLPMPAALHVFYSQQPYTGRGKSLWQERGLFSEERWLGQRVGQAHVIRHNN